MSIPHKTFNTQFPAQAIHGPEHFRYNLVPKTEVRETRTDNSSTIHDPAQCSAHVLSEKFILLNSRLNLLFVESKNASIGVPTRKLWLSEVDAADSQGCAEIRAHPRFPFCPDFLNYGTSCSASMVPGTNIFSPWPSHNHKQTTHHTNSPGNRTKSVGHYVAPRFRIKPRWEDTYFSERISIPSLSESDHCMTLVQFPSSSLLLLLPIFFLFFLYFLSFFLSFPSLSFLLHTPPFSPFFCFWLFFFPPFPGFTTHILSHFSFFFFAFLPFLFIHIVYFLLFIFIYFIFFFLNRWG